MGVFKNHDRDGVAGNKNDARQQRAERNRRDDSDNDSSPGDDFHRMNKDKKLIRDAGYGAMAGSAAALAAGVATGGVAGVVGAIGAAAVLLNGDVRDGRGGRARQTREYDENGRLDTVNGYRVERRGGENGYYDDQGYWHRV